MAKGRLQNEATRPTAQRVLAHTLGTLLRLLHPIMPFITEEVWQLLNQAAPVRGARSAADDRQHHDCAVADGRRIASGAGDRSPVRQVSGGAGVWRDSQPSEHSVSHADRLLRAVRHRISRPAGADGAVLPFDGQRAGQRLRPAGVAAADQRHAERRGAGDLREPGGSIDVPAEIARNEKSSRSCSA